MLETGCNDFFFFFPSIQYERICREQSITACPVEATQIMGVKILRQTQQKADCKRSEKLLVVAVLVLLIKNQLPFRKSETSHFISLEVVHAITL